MKTLLKTLILCCAILLVASTSEAMDTLNLGTASGISPNLTITAGMNLEQMNAVIASANAGDVVMVEAGTYVINGGKILMKPGVTLIRKGAVNPIFDATGVGQRLLIMTYATGEFDNCQIRGITFHNISFRIEGSKNIKFKYCTFDYGMRTPNTDKNTYNDAYILLTRTDKALIDHCVFYRRSGNSGRAIWNAYASQTRIINCIIGDGAELGYFVTAINETGTNNTLIQGNTIKRNPMLNSVDAETDHGIYAHTFNGVIIKNNAISGWPTSATGGGIKARNGEHITISRNTLTGSGILLYEYNGTHVPYLKYVVVMYNTIHISTNATDNYHGIGYWRNNANESEYSIKISHNTLPNGTIRIVGKDVDTANFNAVGGGVFNNDIGTLDLKSGINNSGNF